MRAEYSHLELAFGFAIFPIVAISYLSTGRRISTGIYRYDGYISR